MKSLVFIFIHCLIVCCFGFYNFSFAEAFGTDNFALMSGALKTFQVHACDGEELRVECFPHTVISIKLALYGRISEQSGLCHSQQRRPAAKEDNTTICSSSSALRVIEAKCQNQRSCRLLVSSRLFKDDSCQGAPKYAEVAYKCRPVEFVNKIACEGKQLPLSCDESLRIFIYSANFGNSQDGVLECPQTTLKKNTEVCQASYATETVMSQCQGKRRCLIMASVETFGNPGCSSSVAKFLKVLFKCVPKEVLKDLSSADDVVETSKEVFNVHTTSYPAWVRGMDRTLPSRIIPFRSAPPTRSIKLEMQRDDILARYINGSHVQDRQVVQLVAKWMSAHKYLAKNTQKLILYLSLSLGVGLVLFITIIVIHLYFAKLSKRTSDLKLEVMPTCADDFFTDSDLEQYEGTEFDEVTNSLRKISDTIPKAPITSQDNSHYFS